MKDGHLSEALHRLEPYAAKVACTVLRGEGGRKATSSLGRVAATSLSYPTSASEKFTSISTVKSTRRGFDTSMGRHRTAACRSSAAPKVREQPKSSGLRLCRSNRLDNPAPHAHSADKMKEPAGPVRRRRSVSNHRARGRVEAEGTVISEILPRRL